jgi:hypothetical protein
VIDAFDEVPNHSPRSAEAYGTPTSPIVNVSHLEILSVGPVEVRIFFVGLGTATLLLNVSAPGVLPDGTADIGIYFELTTTTGNWTYAFIAVFYDDTMLPDEVVENTLALYYWNIETAGWAECENTYVDTEANVIYANITHLTTFAPLGFVDTDLDGYLDIDDAFPTDATEWSDADEDGQGDNSDPDDDNDGMPDDWESQYELNPFVADAEGDLDKDGYTNAEEYEAGTNPTDPKSHPVIEKAERKKVDYTGVYIAVVVIIIVLIVAFIFSLLRKPKREAKAGLEKRKEPIERGRVKKVKRLKRRVRGKSATSGRSTRSSELSDGKSDFF